MDYHLNHSRSGNIIFRLRPVILDPLELDGRIKHCVKFC